MEESIVRECAAAYTLAGGIGGGITLSLQTRIDLFQGEAVFGSVTFRMSSSVLLRFASCHYGSGESVDLAHETTALLS